MKNFDFIASLAERQILQNGDIPLTAIFFNSSGRAYRYWIQLEVIEEQQGFADFCARAFVTNNAVEYYFIYTAWIQIRTNIDNTPVDQLEDRQEMLILYGEDGTPPQVRLWQVIRDQGGRILELKLQNQLKQVFLRMPSNPFFRLLPKHRKHEQSLDPHPQNLKVYGPLPLFNPAHN